MMTKACTLAKRHKWTFIKNVTRRYQNGSTVQFSRRGAYRCECGAVKYAEPDINHE